MGMACDDGDHVLLRVFFCICENKVREMKFCNKVVTQKTLISYGEFTILGVDEARMFRQS